MKKSCVFRSYRKTLQGEKPNPDKTEIVKRFPISQTIFCLGLFFYYRKFIKYFARITKSLIKFLKKDAKVNIEYIKSFEIYKPLNQYYNIQNFENLSY